MEPTLLTINNLSVTTNRNAKRTSTPNPQQPKLLMNQNIKYATPALRRNGRNEGYSIEDPTTEYINNSKNDCNGSPTEDSVRRRAIATIKRHDAKHQEQKEYTDWIKDSYNQPSLTSPKINPLPIQETNMIPPTSNNHPRKTWNAIFPEDFPASLNSTGEYITEQDGEMYIPLHSTIPLKKRRRMPYLPLEFGKLTMNRLVDAGAFINTMSWSDYNLIKKNSDCCVTKEYPQTPFKIECANAQLEQPIATADIQFNIGTCTFTDTFVILSTTSFPKSA